MKYVVLFIGTPYMDGMYQSIEIVYEVLERHRRRFPNLRVEWAQVSPNFVLPDDVFWANHKETLKAESIVST